MERPISGNTPTALLLGAGYCAAALTPHLRARGYRVIATTRSQARQEGLSALEATPLLYPTSLEETVSPPLQSALKNAEIILSSIPPQRGQSSGAPDAICDPFLRTIGSDLSRYAENARWVGYLSATSVYGDRAGGWAFEDELLRPVTARGRNRVLAELDWLETGLPVHIFRLAGIYGPEIAGQSRSPFARLRAGEARAVIKPGHIVNRIHVDDIVSAILASIERPNPMRVYNLADDHPAPPQAVLDFAADLIAVNRAPRVDHDTAQISDMARSFYKETKRISNQRAKTDLGWTPHYKDYRLGLLSIARAEQDTPDLVWIAGHMDVPEPNRDAVMAALPDHITQSRAEPGCTRFDIWQSPDHLGRFHVFERFKTLRAFRQHQARLKHAPWAKASQNAVRDYVCLGGE